MPWIIYGWLASALENRLCFAVRSELTVCLFNANLLTSWKLISSDITAALSIHPSDSNLGATQKLILLEVTVVSHDKWKVWGDLSKIRFHVGWVAPWQLTLTECDCNLTFSLASCGCILTFSLISHGPVQLAQAAGLLLCQIRSYFLPTALRGLEQKDSGWRCSGLWL